MKIGEILNEIEKIKTEADETWKSYWNLNGKLNELSDILCDNITFEDLRPMKKEDIVVGKRIFGKNSEGFYTLIIEKILDFQDLDFKSYEADGSRYGIFEKYVLKEDEL